ncbi:MAG: hypothetical protein DRP06_01970 [Candidatus Aenigmatarchaeota archaeon]|nr:MAG: hypothetical protein DRP06_01970 [Candidatus Aenigmarchaeota archaeon]
MKGKIKKEFQITAPKLFGNVKIGVTRADKPDKIIGRKFSIYACDLNKNMKKYYYKFHFKITDVEEDKANCSLAGYEVSKSYLSKNIRKFSTRIDGRIKGKTKDGKEIVLKVFVITAKNVQTSVSKVIRQKIENFINLSLSGTDLEVLMNKIFKDELQRDLKRVLNIIYPISTVEIMKAEISIPAEK